MLILTILLLLIESSTDTGWYHYAPPPPHYYSSRPDQPHYESPPSHSDQPQYHYATGIYQSVCTVYLYLPIVSTATASDRSYPVPLTDIPQPSKILVQAVILNKPNPLHKMKQPFTMCLGS